MKLARYRPLLPVALVLLGLAALHGTPLGDAQGDYLRLKSWLDAQGTAAPLWFMLGGGLLVAVGVPRLTLYFLGGMAFGFAAGLLYAQLASTLGATLTFVTARWAGRDWVEARLAHHPALRRLLDQRSALAVLMLRQLPISSLAISLALGVRHMPAGVFLLGSFLGFLPQGIPFALLGSGLGKTSLWLSLAQVAVGALMLLAMTGSGLHLYRLWREIEPKLRPDVRHEH